MANPVFTLPSLDVAVDFVCNASVEQGQPFHKGSFAKTKFVSVHPTQPLTLSLDEYGVISVWDVDAKVLVWTAPAANVAREALAQCYQSLHPNPDEQRKNALRMKHGSLARLNGPALRNMGHVAPPNFAAPDAAAAPATPPLPPEVLKDSLGDVKAVDFADPAYILHQGGRDFAPGLHLVAQHRVTLLFDQALVVFNYQRGRVQGVLRTQEHLSKAKPTCWEWLSVSHVAVGGQDGVVRVFEDVGQHRTPGAPPRPLSKAFSLVQAFSLHAFGQSCVYHPPQTSSVSPTSGEASLLRVVPPPLRIKRPPPHAPPAAAPLSEEEDEELSALAQACDQTVHVLSVSGDGSVLAWRLTFAPDAALFLGTDHPVTRLAEPLTGLAHAAAAGGSAQTAGVVITTPVPARYDRQHRLLVDAAYDEPDAAPALHPASEPLAPALLDALRASLGGGVARVKLQSATLQLLAAEGVVRVFDLTAAFLAPLLLLAAPADQRDWLVQLPPGSAAAARQLPRRDSHLSGGGSDRFDAADAAAGGGGGARSGGRRSLFGVFQRRHSSKGGALDGSTGGSTGGGAAAAPKSVTLLPPFAALKPAKDAPDVVRRGALASCGLAPLPAVGARLPGVYALPSKHDALALVHSAALGGAVFAHHRQHLAWQRRLQRALLPGAAADDADGCCYSAAVASLAPPPPPASPATAPALYAASLAGDELVDEAASAQDEAASTASSTLPAAGPAAAQPRRFSSQAKRFSSVAGGGGGGGAAAATAAAMTLYGQTRSASAWRLEALQSWASLTDLVVAHVERSFARQADDARDAQPAAFVAQRLAQLREHWAFDKAERLKVYAAQPRAGAAQLVLSTNVGVVLLRLASFYAPPPPAPSSSGAVDGGGCFVSQCLAAPRGRWLRQDVAYVAELHALRRRVLVADAVAGPRGGPLGAWRVVSEDTARLPALPAAAPLLSLATAASAAGAPPPPLRLSAARPSALALSPCGRAVAVAFASHVTVVVVALGDLAALAAAPTLDADAAAEALGALSVVERCRASHAAWTPPAAGHDAWLVLRVPRHSVVDAAATQAAQQRWQAAQAAAAAEAAAKAKAKRLSVFGFGARDAARGAADEAAEEVRVAVADAFVARRLRCGPTPTLGAASTLTAPPGDALLARLARDAVDLRGGPLLAVTCGADGDGGDGGAAVTVLLALQPAADGDGDGDESGGAVWRAVSPTLPALQSLAWRWDAPRRRWLALGLARGGGAGGGAVDALALQLATDDAARWSLRTLYAATLAPPLAATGAAQATGDAALAQLLGDLWPPL